MKYYHVTPVKNMVAIQKDGLKPETFLAENIELARAFAVLYGWSPYALFEVNISSNAVVISDDHNEEYFKALLKTDSAKCYMTFNDIAKENLTLLGVWEFDRP
ncbi:hypothetical protein JavanS250_0011 [Streptococcus satellite phage Javan250]|uniref:hypothetical protein n=1 Tax=Streptococcus halotolerans TaxID=1814128 RepID=UPI000788623C|nr:hypothetical protein [Streptococcus halotolerans]QBX08344.1 hypothetical protein JavanS250_0011 [Streptococcus satellite phage Javan250]